MRLYLSSYGLGEKPEELLKLLDGKVRTAIIMNARDYKSEGRSERLRAEIDSLSGLGLMPVELDLRNYFGKKAELQRVLSTFDFVWVRGGNVFLLRQAYRQSGFDEILIQLLRSDDIVYGGFSAGACVLSPSLKGIETIDSKDATAPGYDKNIIWDGLGVIDFAVAPHYKSDHPESADVDTYVDYLKACNMSYRVLRDGEAIVINDDTTTFVSL